MATHRRPIPRTIDGITYECNPVLSAESDCDDAIRNGQDANQIANCREEPDEALCNAMGRRWIVCAAGGTDDDDEQWERIALPWLAKYNAAYRARARQLAK